MLVAGCPLWVVGRWEFAIGFALHPDAPVASPRPAGASLLTIGDSPKPGALWTAGTCPRFSFMRAGRRHPWVQERPGASKTWSQSGVMPPQSKVAPLGL